MSDPTNYPSNWPGARPQTPDPDPNPAPPGEALLLAIDGYIAALTDEEFTALVARTRNGV